MRTKNDLILGMEDEVMICAQSKPGLFRWISLPVVLNLLLGILPARDLLASDSPLESQSQCRREVFSSKGGIGRQYMARPTSTIWIDTADTDEFPLHHMVVVDVGRKRRLIEIDSKGLLVQHSISPLNIADNLAQQLEIDEVSIEGPNIIRQLRSDSGPSYLLDEFSTLPDDPLLRSSPNGRDPRLSFQDIWQKVTPLGSL